MARLKDTVLTHNHPGRPGVPEGDLRGHGNSFSLADLALAMEAQVAEIRVVTPRWRYSIRRPSEGRDADYFSTHLLPSFQRHETDVRLAFIRAIRARRMTRVEAGARFFHEVWTRVALELGLEYRQEN